MNSLALLFPLRAGASAIALVWLQEFCLLLQCSFSSLCENSCIPGQVMAACTDFEAS